MALVRSSSILTLVAVFAGVAPRFLRAWREDPGKVTLVLGLATTAAVASGWAKAVDGRPAASKMALGGAFVGGVTTTVASFWLADNNGVAPRRRRTSYFILVVGMACLFVAVGLCECEFDIEFFMDICNAIL